MLPLFKVHEALYDICHILFRQAVEHWQTHQALALFVVYLSSPWKTPNFCPAGEVWSGT